MSGLATQVEASMLTPEQARATWHAHIKCLTCYPAIVASLEHKDRTIGHAQLRQTICPEGLVYLDAGWDQDGHARLV